MNTKDMMQALLWAGVTFLLAIIILPKILPQPPQPPPEQSAPGAPAGAPSGAQATPGTAAPLKGPAPAAGAQNHLLTAAEADKAETFTLGQAEANGPYRLEMVLSNLGASVERVTLSDYSETVSGEERYGLMKPAERVGGRTYRALAVENINIDNADLPLADRKWHAEPFETEAGQGLTFTLDVLREGAPLVRLTRRFLLPRQSAASRLHDVDVDLTVENLDAQPHDVVVTYRGGLGFRRSGGRADERHVDVGVMQEGRVSGSRTQITALFKEAGKPIYDGSAADPNDRLWWAAVGNRYFTCTVAPLNPDGTEGPATIREVRTEDCDGLAETLDDATVAFITRVATLAPAGTDGSRLDLPAEVYMGPKDPKTFNGVAKYAQRNYYYQIAQGFGWCTFTWLVELMIWTLNSIYYVCRDFGIALLVLVAIVRIALHPITKFGQVNMIRMQKQMGSIQPKMEEIKKKFANDKTRQHQETQKLMHESGINPLGQMLGCLPMMLQIPIWGALYFSLNSNILMRHKPFLWSWPVDLTAPDAFISLASPINLPLLGEVSAFNLLPFLLGISMYIQQKLMPKPTPPPGQSDQQKQQAEMMQKMMPLMSVFMVFVFYSAQSGLTLYIMISSLIGAAEQYYIRKHIKEQEANGAFDGPRVKKPKSPKRRNGLLARLQKMAEDAQKGQHASHRNAPRSRKK